MITKSAPHLLAPEDIESLRTLAACFERAKIVSDNIGIRQKADGRIVDYLEGSELRQLFSHMSDQFESFRINLRQIESNSKPINPDVSRENL